MRNQSPARPKKVLEINVSDVAFGGDGIAREDGKVIFIEHAVAGERVEVELLQDKKRFARARVLRYLEPAVDAVPAFCKVFGSCGGCNWQHVPYAKQLEWKSNFIKSALFKNARLELDHDIEVLGSDDLKNYRNRIKLKARVNSKQRLEFGFFARSSHVPVFIDHCPIADVAVNAFLSELKTFSFTKPFQWQGDVEVQALAQGKRLLHFTPEFPKEALSQLRKHFPDDEIEAKDTLLFEEAEGLSYATQTGQFQQVNVKGNRFLRKWIKDKIESIGASSVLDLFCGSGNLSLQLLNGKRRVWGLELAGKAIDTAQINLKENDLSGGTYRLGPVSELFQIFEDLPKELDCIITDPPRQGMDDSLEEVLKLRPKHILSVSCDPNTFARDLKGMLDQGYVLKEIFGIDFFPHTYHVETIAHLSRV